MRAVPNYQALRITVGSRLFTLLALGAPVLWYRDRAALIALAAVGAVWLVASVAERRPELTPMSPIAEGAAIGVICGLTLGSSEAILLALVLPPFVGAVLRGLRGALLALSAELVTVVTFALLAEEWSLTDEQSFATFTWAMAGLGLGMIGSFVHATVTAETDELAPYRDAQRLLRQLLDLSDDLSSGLDVVSLAGSVLGDVGDAIPTESLALYAPRGEVLVPLAARSHDSQHTLGAAEELAGESWASAAPVVRDHAFAFPVGESAILGGVVSTAAGLDTAEVERTIGRLRDELRAKSVQLDTAVLFSDFRDSASADVRKRLAREMHDGVAQDIASLGYLVDALAARPASDKQAKQLATLRERITAIVAEVRQSVLSLRTSIGEAQSLGTAIGTVARHLSESSRIPIQVTLDEQATRLRPEVEAELFRITQEAMNNAVKHAQCSSIEVHCQVYAPDVLITVSDDGRGLQQARSDSHGLKIMRERARLVGAELSIDDQPTGGLRVAVRISSST